MVIAITNLRAVSPLRFVLPTCAGMFRISTSAQEQKTAHVPSVTGIPRQLGPALNSLKSVLIAFRELWFKTVEDKYCSGEQTN